MIKAFLACLSFLVLSAASAQERATPDQLEQWMAYYYLAPHPEEVASALEAVTAKGFFENDDAQAPMSGFFTEIFRANPDKVGEWVKPYMGIPSRHILYSALWMANSKESRTALEKMAQRAAPEEAKALRALASSPPPTVESMTIDSPASLDYMWGYFSASGSDKPVLRVIDQMKLGNTKGNASAMLIGGAAQWSVSANARQHEKVLKIVKANVKTADPETKALLEEILAGIDAEKAKK